MCKMLVRGSRIGLMAGLAGSIIETPSSCKEYSQTPGSTGPTVTLQTPLVSWVMAVRPEGHWPLTYTSSALGARMRNVTRRSSAISADRTGGGPWGRRGAAFVGATAGCGD